MSAPARDTVRRMASATPSPAPNPNAMKFTLDTTLPARLNYDNAEAARGDAFAEAVFGIDGVVALFGMNDFVTVTREDGADWEPIVAGVQDAAARLL